MGYPLHADMQSGAWNPLIWIIGYTTNYSLAAFHYELMFYLAMGGIGFYYLGRDLGWNKYTALLIGFAYEFSGPILDSMQFSAFVSSACYIPFVFLFFRRTLNQQQPTVNAVLTALFFYLLFTGGYPAFFIISFYILVVFLLHAFFSSTQKLAFAKKLILPLGIFLSIFILLSLPALLSFVNHLKFIERGNKQGLDFLLENSMPPSCMLSLISPFTTTATTSFFDTNILMRNIYIGIVPLFFLCASANNKVLWRNKAFRFFLITAIVLFGLAWGSHFFLRQAAYYILPLMDTFRHPALFRLFGVLFILLAAGISIEEWNKNNYNNERLKKLILISIGILLVLGLCLVIFSKGGLVPANFNTSQVKTLLVKLNFQQRFLIQLPFIIATLGLLYFTIAKKKSLVYVLLIALADLFFATQLNMPITVIGARNFSATELLIDRNPVKFPLPGNTTIEQNSLHSIDTTQTIGSKLPFEKKIGRNEYFITPGNLILQDKFFESSIREKVFKNRPLYCADTILQIDATKNAPVLPNTNSFAIVSPTKEHVTGTHTNSDTISIKNLSANTAICQTGLTRPRLLVFLQNVYPGWKVFVDGKESPILITNISFMGVVIPEGGHEIVFRYHPEKIIYAWYISLCTLFGVALFLLWSVYRNIIFSDNHNQRNTNRKPE
jgi:hypothetical protein